jgi:hypothetical protein
MYTFLTFPLPRLSHSLLSPARFRVRDDERPEPSVSALMPEINGHMQLHLHTIYPHRPHKSNIAFTGLRDSLQVSSTLAANILPPRVYSFTLFADDGRRTMMKSSSLVRIARTGRLFIPDLSP